MERPSRDGWRRSALLLIDVINAFDFPDAESMLATATKAAPRIAALSRRARDERVPVIYVNDHFGDWRSDFAATVVASTRPKSRGRTVAMQLVPHKSDFFVLKPGHSGFYSTTLSPLLDHLKVGRLVLVGFATNYCVLFTANDAYMRGFELVVPSDCTAAASPSLTKAALAHIRESLKGKTPQSASTRFR
jgi:nicotinamidase-related amidase